MAMPVTDDCNPAIAGAARRLRAASVSGSLQGYAQLAFDHGLDEAAHPITHHGFNRVEPIVEKMHSRISDRLRGIMLRGNALHGVVSYPALLRRIGGKKTWHFPADNLFHGFTTCLFDTPRLPEPGPRPVRARPIPLLVCGSGRHRPRP